MNNFNNFFNTKEIKRFYSPTKIFFGKDSRKLLFDLCQDRKILLVVTKSFSKDPLIKNLRKANPELTLLEIHGEPNTNFIDEKLKKIPNNIDCIVAIGGGSAIDSAKAIYAKKIFGIYKQLGYGKTKNVEPIVNRSKITFIALPTSAGSGSEVSRYYLIFDSKTKEKTVSRSWSICPEYAILDPYFLYNAPKKVLILGAFDAFVHLFETCICRYEQSILNDMLILEGIPKILKAMNKILKSHNLDENDLINLQLAATLGGISLSNVRTGLMHDMGEALSATTNLNHPETLFVFFESIMNYYNNSLFDKKKILLNKLKQENIKLVSLEKLGIFWKKILEKEHLISSIKEKLPIAKIDKKFILTKTLADKVLLSKESPVGLRKKDIINLINKSFKRFDY